MALSLQRDFGEEIVLYTSDGEIVLYFASPAHPDGYGKGVQVGIKAPSSVKIMRAELVKRR